MRCALISPACVGIQRTASQLADLRSRTPLTRDSTRLGSREGGRGTSSGRVAMLPTQGRRHSPVQVAVREHVHLGKSGDAPGHAVSTERLQQAHIKERIEGAWAQTSEIGRGRSNRLVSGDALAVDAAQVSLRGCGERRRTRRRCLSRGGRSNRDRRRHSARAASISNVGAPQDTPPP